MPWYRNPNVRGGWGWQYPPGVQPDPPGEGRAAPPAPPPPPSLPPLPRAALPPPPPPPPQGEKAFVAEAKNSMREQMRERELNASMVRNKHNQCHAEVPLEKGMRKAYNAIMHVIDLACQRIHARYVSDGLDPVHGALHRQYSVTATGALRVRPVTLRLYVSTTPSGAKSSRSRQTGLSPGPYDAITWSVKVVPKDSPFRMAVNDALAAGGYNNCNRPDGMEQITVNTTKSLRYALNGIWSVEAADEMVEDDLLPDEGDGDGDDASNFEVQDVVDETPETNSRRGGSSVSGASVSSDGAPTPATRSERDPQVARFFENFGAP